MAIPDEVDKVLQRIFGPLSRRGRRSGLEEQGLRWRLDAEAGLGSATAGRGGELPAGGLEPPALLLSAGTARCRWYAIGFCGWSTAPNSCAACPSPLETMKTV